MAWAMTMTTQAMMRRVLPTAAAAAAPQVQKPLPAKDGTTSDASSLLPQQHTSPTLLSALGRGACNPVMCLVRCAAGGASESTDSEEADQDRVQSRDTDMGDADEAAAPAGGALKCPVQC